LNTIKNKILDSNESSNNDTLVKEVILKSCLKQCSYSIFKTLENLMKYCNWKLYAFESKQCNFVYFPIFNIAFKIYKNNFHSKLHFGEKFHFLYYILASLITSYKTIKNHNAKIKLFDNEMSTRRRSNHETLLSLQICCTLSPKYCLGTTKELTNYPL